MRGLAHTSIPIRSPGPTISTCSAQSNSVPMVGPLLTKGNGVQCVGRNGMASGGRPCATPIEETSYRNKHWRFAAPALCAAFPPGAYQALIVPAALEEPSRRCASSCLFRGMAVPELLASFEPLHPMAGSVRGPLLPIITGRDFRAKGCARAHK
jgi:hypothetical protein